MIYRQLLTALFVTIVFCTIFLPANYAYAQNCSNTVAVLPFDGDDSGALNQAVKEALASEGCRTIDEAKLRRTAKRLRVRLGSTKGYQRIAKRLSVDLFIAGQLQKQGRRWVLDIKAYDNNGTQLASADWKSSQKNKLTRLARRKAYSLLQGALEPVVESSRIAVAPFEGPQNKQVRSYVLRALKKQGYETVAQSEYEEALLQIGGSLTSEQDYVTLATELKANAIVTGQVAKRGRGYKVQIQVHNGENGQELGSSSWTARRGRGLRTIRTSFNRRLGDAIATSSPPQEPEPEPMAEEPQEEVDEGPSGAHRYAALDAGAGMRIFSRNLSYTDDINNSLRGYEVFPAFAVSVALDWFPGAHFTDSALAHFGLTGSFDTTLGLSSSTESGTADFPTSMTAFSIGAIGRIPIDDLHLLIDFTYGSQRFEIEDADALTPRPDIANVNYGFLRAGVGARYALSDRFALLGKFGYRFVMSSGEIGEQDYFPRVSIGALDLDLGAGFRIWKGLEARASLYMQRYFMSMNSEPGDMRVAGGATDQYFGINLGIAYRLGGDSN